MKRRFYLGRLKGDAAGDLGETPFTYDPDDLTTHGVILGMTGSGKTGLGIGLLEEAARKRIPALILDPKGDLTNELLHFPRLAPEDFEPWINPDEARRAGKTTGELAAEKAALWQKGLAAWGLGPEQIRELDRVRYAVYTPGSTAGIPVSILASLRAPAGDWRTQAEELREQVASTATALLGLVGYTDLDPVTSREHILTARILEEAWRAGRDLDLGELIMQVQNPPFAKLGVFDTDTFFPPKERFGLAMRLNNILAAPAFQVWTEGEPLDVGALLYAPDGTPRHSVFYIAHLSDEERMFFVTLLLAALESWTRKQAGTTALRALLYFDEIFGYLPPGENPPSKGPMLRLLKQARAFGVGLLLATQNPVDVDYKALTNAGTWFIGRLQTQYDKQRLLDGLEGVSGGLDRDEFDRLISSLGKRVFLAKNVHEKRPALFGTRWVMNYLAGPLTREQIPALNGLVGAQAGPPGEKAAAAPSASGAAAAAAEPEAQELPGFATRPAVPAGVEDYVLPASVDFVEAVRRVGVDAEGPRAVLYRPELLAQAEVRFARRKYGLNTVLKTAALVPPEELAGLVRWEDHPHPPFDEGLLEGRPEPDARWEELPAELADTRALAKRARGFKDWVYRSAEARVWHNPHLKLYGAPELGREEFLRRCLKEAEWKAREEAEKLRRKYERKIAGLKKKLRREERELAEDEAELARRKMEEMGGYLDTVIGLFGGRKRALTGALSKRRMTARAKEDVEESRAEIAALEQEIQDLLDELEAEVGAIEDRWEELARAIESIQVTPYKKDVAFEYFGIAWVPYYVLDSGERIRLVRAH
ncbi:helicase HerA domain-containing protein [Deinococcota bacterium DY0809b]